MNEVVLSGGFVNRIVRIGDTVRRPSGPWTPAVHALLSHLEASGFAESPRALGVGAHSNVEGFAAEAAWIRENRAVLLG